MALSLLRPRVLSLVFDPEVQPGRRLSRALGWNDPLVLEGQYIADVAEASHGLVEYRVVDRLLADEFPQNVDGFRYTPETFLAA